MICGGDNRLMSNAQDLAKLSKYTCIQYSTYICRVEDSYNFFGFHIFTESKSWLFTENINKPEVPDCCVNIRSFGQSSPARVLHSIDSTIAPSSLFRN